MLPVRAAVPELEIVTESNRLHLALFGPVPIRAWESVYLGAGVQGEDGAWQRHEAPREAHELFQPG
jgi:hypothetical protein